MNNQLAILRALQDIAEKIDFIYDELRFLRTEIEKQKVVKS